MHLLLYFIRITMHYTCLSGALIGDECKVHIDNRHMELKELIGNQFRFAWTNWSHLISLLMLALLFYLLSFVYCYVKLKCGPTVKHSHSPPSLNHRQPQSSVIEAPYVIKVRDRAPQQQQPPQRATDQDSI